jgi:hypothetical protein
MRFSSKKSKREENATYGKISQVNHNFLNIRFLRRPNTRLFRIEIDNLGFEYTLSITSVKKPQFILSNNSPWERV